MKRLLLLNIVFLASICAGQVPSLQINHAFLVLDSSDYSALTNSDFIKNEFSGFFTRSTSTNTTSWTGAYIFGDINYLEIFAPSGSEHPVGTSAFSLGADHIGDLVKTKDILAKKYRTQIEIKQRKVKDSIIPWFQALYIIDSSFSNFASISFWIMEYEKDYFLFNHWDTNGDSVTRKVYLLQHEEKRRNKILKRFSGIEFYATKSEVDFYSFLLLNCGFTKISLTSFISTEGFKITFKPKLKSSKYSIKNLQFATSKSSHQEIAISDHIKVVLNGDVGSLEFN